MRGNMRRYEKKTEKELVKAVCNKCGRELKVENGVLKEGCFSAEVAFGYFSRKDGTIHKFDLCEDCYDEMTAQFAVPVESGPNTELL